MLTLHLVVCFIALLAGAVVLIALSQGARSPAWTAVLLLTSALISLTGFVLPAPPGTPSPDPAQVVGVIALAVVVIAALALYVYHLARAWSGVYVVTVVFAVYLNAFVGVTQAFQKIGPLHALAPTGKEPAFLIAQTLTLVLFVAIGIIAFRHRSSRTVISVI
jgi:hypothetical protein